MMPELKKTYLRMLLPAAAGTMLICLAKLYELLPWKPLEFQARMAPIVFVLSAIAALAFPMLYRTLFAYRVRHLRTLSPQQLLKLERRLIVSALLTPYLTMLALLFELPRFHVAGTVLLTLYAVYFYYPSERRIRFDRQIFRVRP